MSASNGSGSSGALAGAGFALQPDCPDLAMARHTAFQELSEADFLKRAAFHVEILNHALRNVPAEQVERIEFLSAADATMRYGTGHASGAILVTTKGH